MTITAEHKKVVALVLGLIVCMAALPVRAADEEPAEEPTPEPTTSPYEFKVEGVLGCNQVAGAMGSAGTMAAIGGVYVPVNDAAVTLNTGMLVYMNCILNPLQTRIRDSVLGSLVKKQTVEIETGRNGNRLYAVNLPKERLAVRDRSRLTFLTDGSLDEIDDESRAAVQRFVARTYQEETRGPAVPPCPYRDIARGIRGENDDPFGTILALSNPMVCNPYFIGLNAKDAADRRDAQAIADMMTRLDWGQGYYDLTNNAEDPFAEEVLTPAVTIREGYQQTLGLSQQAAVMMRQVGDGAALALQNVVSAALGPGGIAGFSKSFAGRPSYLEQIAKETSQGVVGAAVNAALTILNAARQIEGSYLAAMNAIAAKLTQTIRDIQQIERNCWNIIVPKAQEYAARQSCTIDPITLQQTCTGGFTLDPLKIRAATSSLAFSQQVVNSQIKAIADVALANVQSSQKAVALIDQLIAGVTNTSSLTAQRVALQQLDQLVAQKALHTQYDAQNAGKQRDDIGAAMDNLKTDTATAWGDSPDPSIGWCNVNNETVVRGWAERWRR